MDHLGAPDRENVAMHVHGGPHRLRDHLAHHLKRVLQGSRLPNNVRRRYLLPDLRHLCLVVLCLVCLLLVVLSVIPLPGEQGTLPAVVGYVAPVARILVVRRCVTLARALTPSHCVLRGRAEGWGGL